MKSGGTKSTLQHTEQCARHAATQLISETSHDVGSAILHILPFLEYSNKGTLSLQLGEVAALIIVRSAGTCCKTEDKHSSCVTVTFPLVGPKQNS